MRIVWAMALVALAAACVPEEDEGSRLSASERAACDADGGRIGIAGLAGGEICIRPTPDAGQACTTSADCETLCLAATMTCEAEYSPFGCKDYIDDNGQRVSICVD